MKTHLRRFSCDRSITGWERRRRRALGWRPQVLMLKLKQPEDRQTFILAAVWALSQPTHRAAVLLRGNRWVPHNSTLFPLSFSSLGPFYRPPSCSLRWQLRPTVAVKSPLLGARWDLWELALILLGRLFVNHSDRLFSCQGFDFLQSLQQFVLISKRHSWVWNTQNSTLCLI